MRLTRRGEIVVATAFLILTLTSMSLVGFIEHM